MSDIICVSVVYYYKLSFRLFKLTRVHKVFSHCLGQWFVLKRHNVLYMCRLHQSLLLELLDSHFEKMLIRVFV